MPEDKRTWYAVYTKPRWEKKVYRLMIEGGVEAYCPLNKVRKKWSDRLKLVEEPLFKSYVFVHIDMNAQQAEVRETNGVLNFVYWLGKPAVIKSKEIDQIRRFLNEHENVTVESMDLRPDDTVMITAGALMEKEGKVLKKYGNTIAIEIKSLGYRLVVQVNRQKVVKKLSQATGSR